MAAPVTEPDSLGSAVNRGAAVTYAGSLASKLIVLVNTVLLARLLAPEHFGLVAIALLVLSVSEAITEAGPAAAVVWRSEAPGEAPGETAAVALTLALLSGAVLALAVFLAAPAIARLFGEPQAAAVIAVFAGCILLSSPAAVFAGILQRRMAFGRRILPEIVRSIVKGAVGIPMALAGFGVWSLVAAHVAAVAAGLALSVVLAGWRPRLGWRGAVLRQVLRYWLHIAAVGLLGVAIRKLDVVILGIRFDATALGFYTVAFTLVELAVMGICWSMSQSLFPALSRAVQIPGRTQAVLEDGLRMLFLVSMPVGVGIAVLAEPFVLTVYGDKWAPAVPLVQILAFYALFFALSFNLGDIYKATGRPHLLVRISLANLALAAPILLLGSRWGPTGIAAAQVVVAALMTGLGWVVARRVAGISPRVLWAACAGPCGAAAGAAVVCVVLDRAWLGGEPPWLQLLALAPVGLVVYAGLVTAANADLRARLGARLFPDGRRGEE